MTLIDRVLREVEAAADETVAFAADLIRIPTVNPPGEAYEECARAIGERLRAVGFDVEYLPAEGRPEHTTRYPRVNVVGSWRGEAERPLVHLNGHFDVVPAGDGWTLDPFGGVVRDGRLYGRGSCDMKAGIAAAAYAAAAVRRAGVTLPGTVEVSGTVDEESGGFAGVAWLAEHGRLSAARTDCVIIPEPLDVDRICVGHRGVYWGELTMRGRIAHGSMPFLGVSAIDAMGRVLEDIRETLRPALAQRMTDVPVVPDAARHPTLNVNAIQGGQPFDGAQTPCVADRCRMIFDRRFLIEEGFDAARSELVALFDRAVAAVPGSRYDLRDLLVVHPTRTPADSRLIAVLDRGIQRVLGRKATIVASPGTYDHKHVARIAGVPHCVAYGPGRLELAHQPDEWCAIDELIDATKVLALAILGMTGAEKI
jgi:succinyl-diaminopimelate desuccinylase